MALLGSKLLFFLCALKLGERNGYYMSCIFMSPRYDNLAYFFYFPFTVRQIKLKLWYIINEKVLWHLKKNFTLVSFSCFIYIFFIEFCAPGVTISTQRLSSFFIFFLFLISNIKCQKLRVNVAFVITRILKNLRIMRRKHKKEKKRKI